jgi:hypothetical protein
VWFRAGQGCSDGRVTGVWVALAERLLFSASRMRDDGLLPWFFAREEETICWYHNLVGSLVRGPALVSVPGACPAISKRQLACSHGTEVDLVSSDLKGPSSRLGRDIIGLLAPHHAWDSAFRSVKVKACPSSTVLPPLVVHLQFAACGHCRWPFPPLPIFPSVPLSSCRHL